MIAERSQNVSCETCVLKTLVTNGLSGLRIAHSLGLMNELTKNVTRCHLVVTGLCLSFITSSE